MIWTMSSELPRLMATDSCGAEHRGDSPDLLQLEDTPVRLVEARIVHIALDRLLRRQVRPGLEHLLGAGQRVAPVHIRHPLQYEPHALLDPRRLHGEVSHC